MPYDQSPALLQRLIEKIIAGSATQQKLESIEVTEQKLKDILTHAGPDIWASASKQIAEFNEIEKHETSLDNDYVDLLMHKPFYLRLFEDFLPAAFGFAILSLLSL